MVGAALGLGVGFRVEMVVCSGGEWHDVNIHRGGEAWSSLYRDDGTL